MAGARTIANLWRNSIAAGHPEPAYLQEIEGEWREVRRREAEAAVTELANALLALGLVGAVGAPIYASSSPRDVQYVLEHSQAVGVLVEDEEQRAKLGTFAG